MHVRERTLCVLVVLVVLVACLGGRMLGAGYHMPARNQMSEGWHTAPTCRCILECFRADPQQKCT